MSFFGIARQILLFLGLNGHSRFIRVEKRNGVFVTRADRAIQGEGDNLHLGNFRFGGTAGQGKKRKKRKRDNGFVIFHIGTLTQVLSNARKKLKYFTVYSPLGLRR